VSEQRQPAGSNFTILASPSLTLGCRSGDAPSFWKIELGERMHASRVRVPVETIEQDEDPPSSSAGTALGAVTDLIEGVERGAPESEGDGSEPSREPDDAD
jgi:hypothetical protein